MTTDRSSGAVLPAGLLVAIGLGVCGWFVGNGFIQAKAADRYVTVKGVAERNVKADLALWPIRFTATDDNLNVAQDRVARSAATIFEFLSRNGIDTAEARVQNFEVTDLLANRYGGQQNAASRYIITETIMVRSTDPDLIFNTNQKIGELVSAGIVLSSGMEYGPSGPTFLFTKLNDLKPEMIGEATANAREAAEQFARDAKSRVGSIRQANQGVFVILPRDIASGITEEQQLFKTVRVVSTIDYFLKQ